MGSDIVERLRKQHQLAALAGLLCEDGTSSFSVAADEIEKLGNRSDELWRERNVLQKICAERSDEIESLRSTVRAEALEEAAKVADLAETEAKREADQTVRRGNFVHAISAQATAHSIAFDIRALKPEGLNAGEEQG
jgi:hypothetical protein